MPLVKIQTNINVSENKSKTLISLLSENTASMLGKSKKYVMVSLEHNPNMLFAGNEQPLAYLEVKSIGLQEEKTADFALSLCNLVTEHLDISADRIYIEFSNAQRHMWGWNSKTF